MRELSTAESCLEVPQSQATHRNTSKSAAALGFQALTVAGDVPEVTLSRRGALVRGVSILGSCAVRVRARLVPAVHRDTSDAAIAHFFAAYRGYFSRMPMEAAKIVMSLASWILVRAMLVFLCAFSMLVSFANVLAITSRLGHATYHPTRPTGCAPGLGVATGSLAASQHATAALIVSRIFRRCRSITQRRTR